MSRLSRAAGASILAAVLMLCVACTAPADNAPTTSGETVSDQQSVITSVQAADPSATRVVATVSQSGASNGWAVEIDHQGDLTADTLAAVLRAVAAVEPEPGHIALYFFAPGTDDAIDIAAAADELGVPWTPTGSGGSWLTGQMGAMTR